MCRGRKTCIALGTDVSVWSKTAVLMPPSWFPEQLKLFGDAVRFAAEGDTLSACERLGLIDGLKIQEWFVEHGQSSAGCVRKNHFKRPAPAAIIPLDPLRSPDKLAPAVYKRDFYQCRYCGLRLVPNEVLLAFSNVVGKDVFGTKGANVERHGIVQGFSADADHVFPHKLGGRTDMDNLVTSCWCCNYGKDRFTTEQLGIDDPRTRSPVTSDWDGLMSYLPGLLKHAK